LTETYSATARQEAEVAQAAGIIALGSVASRILGIIRETVKAGLFGATGSVSALEVAIRVPTLVYDLMVGGMINSALIPVLSEYAGSDRRDRLWRLLSVLLSLAAVVLSVVTLIGELLAPQIVWIMAGGLDPTLQREAVDLLRLMLPAIFFLNVAGIVSGALYALKRFAFPAFTAAVFNAAIVVTALLLGGRLGVMSIALGLLAGSVLQLALQMPGLRDARLHFILDVDLDALRRIGKLYIPIALGLVVDMLGVALSYHLASRTGDQSIPWMQYSATIIQFPLGLVSIAVSIAILPTLSRQAASDKPERYRATLTHGLRLVMALTIPATVGLWILAEPIVALVFEHGGYFTPSDTQATVAALHCHLLGLVFAAIDQPLIFAFYARKDTGTPALVGVGTVILYMIIALAPTLFRPLSLNWLILANSLKSAAHALTMLFLLRRRMGALRGHGVWQAVLKATLASAVMGGAVWLVVQGVTSIAPPSGFREFALVASGCIVGAGVYWLLASVLHIGEVADLGHMLLARVRVLTMPRR